MASLSAYLLIVLNGKLAPYEKLEGCGMNTKLVVSLVITCLVVIFILQNMTVVKVNFLFWSLSMSRSLLVIVFVGVGVMVGWLLSSYASYRHRHK